MRHPALIILEALLGGELVHVNGEVVAMAENNKLGMPMLGNADKVITYDCDISSFINMCEKATKEEIFGITANTALNKVKKDERKNRKGVGGE